MADGLPEIDRLQNQLLSSGIQQSNPALYQVINQLIKAVIQFQKLTNTTITTIIGSGITNLVGDVIANGPGIVNATVPALQSDFLTWSDESAGLPNSRELLAGIGITFDDSIANERTINGSPTGTSYVPVSTGAEPLEIMSDGAGHVLLIAFAPP